MKIIVCGGGNVGQSIVSYLVKGNNDIVVIDSDDKVVEGIVNENDVNGVVGNGAAYDILMTAYR